MSIIENEFQDLEGQEPIEGFVNHDLEKKKEEARRIAKLLRSESNNTIRYIVTLEGETKKDTELTKEEKTVEFFRCALDPIYFIETYLTIFDQTQNSIVPFKLFDFQKDLIEQYKSNRFNVANKYRQAGVSTTTCAYITWYVMFNENAKVAVVANKLETARDELMSDIIDFIAQCPDYLQPVNEDTTGKKAKAMKDAAGHKKYQGGREIKAFAPSTLRGLTPTLIFWDETAWAERGDKFWESARPTLQTGGGAIFVSTPNGLDPVFYETFTKAPKNKFNAVELWWYNDPRYNKELEWVKGMGTTSEFRIKDENFNKEKRKQMVNDGFKPTSPWFEENKASYNGNDRQLAQEMLCSFLGSGDNFVGEEHIHYAKENTKKEPIRTEYTDKNMWIWEDPIPDCLYVAGVDVSKGNSEDSASISILKVNIVEEIVTSTDSRGNTKQRKRKRRICEQVAEYYGKKSPQELALIVNHYGRHYNYAYTVVDITGGYGSSTVDKLKEIGYENLYYSEIGHKGMKDMLSGFVKTGSKEKQGNFVDVELYPGLMITGQNRPVMLIELERAIRSRDFIIRSTRLIKELETFQTDKNPNKLADHTRTTHDDAIFASVLALYIVAYDLDTTQESISRTKALLEAMTRVNNASGAISRVVENKAGNSAWYARGVDPREVGSWLFRDKQMYIQHIMQSEGISRADAEERYYASKPFR
jgi:hypothetical protein